jgi:hypothetical protein
LTSESKLNTFENYSTTDFQTNSASFQSRNELTESSLFSRHQRALNPVFRYDYKLGNYFTKSDSLLSPYLFTTINEITGGIRKSSWFFSKKFVELFGDNLNSSFPAFFTDNKGAGFSSNPYNQPTFAFYALFNSLSKNSHFLNTR